jgi:Secretion system C-terminal sorting domain
MTKILTLALALFTALTLTAQNPISRRTVSMGAGYAQNVWYNLATDAEVKGAAAGWNLAISVRPFDAAIFIQPFDNVYKPVNTGANFTAVTAADTSRATLANQLFNTDTSWNVGAMNRTLAGLFDYGWGSYNQVTNNVTGDSTYLYKTSAGVWKKIFIERLSFDTMYSIRVANLDGSNNQVFQVNKRQYSNKNFVYLNINTGAVLDLEPAANTWDLMFTRYQTLAPDPVSGQLGQYVVAGALQNSLVGIVRGVPVITGVQTIRRISRDTTNDGFDTKQLSVKISNIGGDWKAFTGTAWTIADSVTYFVRTQSAPNQPVRFYKIIFKEFGGTGTGNFVFTKETLPVRVSTKDVLGRNAALAITPNPATDGNLTVVYDLGYSPQNVDFQLFNLSGQSVFSKKLPNTEGVQTLSLPTLNLQAGMYFAQIRFDGKVLTQKVVVR